MADTHTHLLPTNQGPLEYAKDSNFESSRIQAATGQQTVHSRKTKKKFHSLSMYVAMQCILCLFGR